MERPAIIPASAWESDPDPMPEEKRHTPQFITIHHAGVLWNEGDDPYRKLTGLQSWGKRDKGWPDVPYHYLIAPDGRIFEGRPMEYEGETNTEYDVTGHALVQIWGNFEEQRMSLEQLESAVQLVAWLCQSLDVSPSTIGGHMDHSEQTVCPGRDLQRHISDGEFRLWVEETMRGWTPEIRLREPLPEGPTEFIPLD
jgi:hypothetical protein